MKILNKLKINSERLMKNEELMTLRGGYGDKYFWLCIDMSLNDCGCISTVTSDQYVASFYCGWFTGCGYAVISDPLEGCYVA